MIYVGKVVRYLRAEIIHAVATCTWYLLPTLMWHLYLTTYILYLLTSGTCSDMYLPTPESLPKRKAKTDPRPTNTATLR